VKTVRKLREKRAKKKRRVRENCGKKSDGNHKGKLAKSIRDFRDFFSHIIPACPSKSKLRPQNTTKSDPWEGRSDALLKYIWPSVGHTFHAHSTHRGYPLGTVLNQGLPGRRRPCFRRSGTTHCALACCMERMVPNSGVGKAS
jgi:hypothetical protein